MGFSDTQVRALARNVPAKAIRSRTVAGKALSYIEGWYALSQANRIFGFDGWDRETVETKCLQGREARGTFTAIYSARVRITVRTDNRLVIRDGHGTGEAYGGSVGEVHDRALKAAETDATKRALATFGKAFGLALYNGNGKVRRHKANGHDQAHTVTTGSAPASSDEVTNGEAEGSVRGSNSRRNTQHPRADAADHDVNGQTFNGSGRPAEDQESCAAESTGSIPNEDSSSAGISPAMRSARIDKSALTFAEPHRIRDKEHLRFVAAQPCLLCNAAPSDAHHLRLAQLRAMGRKVGDQFTVPLCRAHHRQLHHCGNEPAFWHDMGIDAIEVAEQLWRDTETERRDPQSYGSG
jgi:Rad52/22 family double-strand break repair protein